MKQNQSNEKKLYIMMSANVDDFKTTVKHHVRCNEIHYWVKCSCIYASLNREFVFGEARRFNRQGHPAMYFVKEVAVIG